MNIVFSEVDDYLNAISAFDISGTQLSSGKFVCHKKELQLPKLVVGNRYISTSMQYHTVLKQDCFYIIIPQGDNGIRIDGQERKFNIPIVFIPGQEVISVFYADTFDYHITIPAVELVKYFDEENIELLRDMFSSQNFESLKFSRTKRYQNYICSLIKLLLNQSNSLNYQAVLDIQENIIELLRHLLTPDSMLLDKNKNNNSTKLAIVKRSLNYLNTSSAINITTPELAAVSFCCLRNLEYAFKSVLGITPKQYLIKRRFQLIYLSIKYDRTTSIHQILNNFGVLNPGRFAQDYYKFYTEYPHQTRNSK
jgi:hypothetical protein